MLKSKLYRLISVLCSICFLANFCGVLQIPTAYAADPIFLTLNYVEFIGEGSTSQDSAEYDSDWGEIWYSSRAEGEYTEINTEEESDGKYKYKLTEDGPAYIKILELGTGVTAQITKDEHSAPTPITEGTAVELTNSATITFTKTADQSGNEIDPTYFIWAYSSADTDLPAAQTENLDKFIVKGGTVSIITSDNDDINGQESAKEGGFYAITQGKKVTIKLTPDYGYQVSSKRIESIDLNEMQARGDIAEETIAPCQIELSPVNESPCTYTFKMPETSVVLGNPFTTSKDKINVTASTIKDAIITNASQLIDSGNYEMNVIDTVLTEDTKKTLSKNIEDDGLTPVSYLDIELSKFWSKADTGDTWDEQITSLTTPAKLSLTLSQPESGKTYKIFKINGETASEIDSSYDSSSGNISFEITDFSSLMLAEGKAATASTITTGGTTTKITTGDHNGLFMYSLLMLLSVLGYIASFKFKKKRNVIWF